MLMRGFYGDKVLLSGGQIDEWILSGVGLWKCSCGSDFVG